MHFVCRNSLNIEWNSDGTFSTKYWKVSQKNAQSVKSVFLHESKSDASYLQGEVIGFRKVQYLGVVNRFEFIIRPNDLQMEWEGNGTGEKGYAYND